MEDRDGRYEGTLSTSQSLPAWKEEINAKLSEHRSRRKLSPEMQGRLAEIEPSFAAGPRQPSTSRIAARVAERYSKAPSYREMLEQEAAAAPARLVKRAPQEIPAHAQTQRASQPDAEPSLFETGASQIPVPAEPRVRVSRWAEFAAPATEEPIPAVLPLSDAAPQVEELFAHPAPLLEPVQPAPLPAPQTSAIPSLDEPASTTESPSEQSALPAVSSGPAEDSETLSLLEELAAAPIEPPQPLPARIIEFPRELVAPHKARPRHEHGPAHDLSEEQSQLRIFEAEPEAVDATVAAPPIQVEPEPAPAIPDWNAIRLDEEPGAVAAGLPADFSARASQSSLLLDPPIYTANFEDRLMAGIVDLCLVAGGFLIFVAAFVTCTPHLPTGKFAIAAAAGALLALYTLYQYLFLNLAEGTPGMRYAGIALCTFDDENPTREAMRARVGATLLSALPLGLGFLWSLFDEDRLGWHDRMTRTYQRSYRQN